MPVRSKVTIQKRDFIYPAVVFLLGLMAAGCGTSDPSLKTTNGSFDFGKIVVSQTSTRDVVTLTNSGSQAATLTSDLQGDASLKLRPELSCGGSLPAGGSCSVAVSFTPTTTNAVSGTLDVTFTSGTTVTHQKVQLAGTGVQLSGGESLVTPTANPLVALYSFQPEQQGTVHVEFGTDTNYGRSTGSVTPVNGGPVSILVAGMKQNTTYHMRAVVTESDGTVVDDQDHMFQTGSFPADALPTLTATTSQGQTPQPGIELLDSTASQSSKDYLEAYAVDLSGNIIWGYTFPDRATSNTIVQPIKLLPNGNFLMVLSFASQFVLPNQTTTLTPADESVDMIREIDLAGDPVAQITIDQLNAKLAAAGYSNMTLLDLHHDVTMLPNGHIIVIAEILKPYTNLAGQSGTTNVLGDVLVDLDPNFNVSWVWSTFDHLDVNRHPVGFPDWTHANAVVYSPDDGDLLLSMRHQSWIVKIDYQDGKGSGDILWRLGNEGDFTLKGGTAPQDWFYGQHDPQFVPGSPTSGVFSLAMMDNGFGRITSSGTCTSKGTACYTTAPILSIDEAAKTATITFRATPPASNFSIWGGSGTALANGDIEYDLCALSNGSEVDEVTTTNPSKPVWTLKETGANLYRAHRIPSLYPGVQW